MSDTVTITPEYCQNWIGDERCGKPAEVIVWGKLFDPDALGPRCYDCAASQIGHNALRSNDHISYAVYRLPALDQPPVEESSGGLGAVRDLLLSLIEGDGTGNRTWLNEDFTPGEAAGRLLQAISILDSEGGDASAAVPENPGRPGTRVDEGAPDQHGAPSQTSGGLGDEERERLWQIAGVIELGVKERKLPDEANQDARYLRNLSALGDQLPAPAEHPTPRDTIARERGTE